MRILFILLVLIFFCRLLIAAPVIYEVAKDEVNVRVDSTILSESLGFLNKGQMVEVLNEKFNWYKVILPKTLNCYVFKGFVKLLGNNRLEVTGANVNLRSRPALDSSVIGKVNKGDTLRLVKSSGDWIEVESYPYATGWVHKDTLRQNDFSPELTSLVDEILPQLSRDDIKSKIFLHKQLIDAGRQIVPLLEAKLPESNNSSVYSLIDILSQIALNQAKSGDWGLTHYFFETAKKSVPRQASIYLDILQNILKPQGQKEAYFYLEQNGILLAENIKTALERFRVELDNI